MVSCSGSGKTEFSKVLMQHCIALLVLARLPLVFSVSVAAGQVAVMSAMYVTRSMS